MDVVRDRLQGGWRDSPQARAAAPMLQNVQAAAQSAFEERPLVTTLMVFGIGLGLGTAIGMVIAECVSEPEPTLSKSYDAITQNVMDTLSRMVPDVIARQFRA